MGARFLLGVGESGMFPSAIKTVTERIATGNWGDTSPEGLNGREPAAGDGKPRYIAYTFATPFNRAFYTTSPHPY